MGPVVVIGGAGFIGRELCLRLAQQGRTVVILGRSTVPDPRLTATCRYVCGDFGNLGDLRSVLTPGCDVIQLAYATVPRTSFGDPVFDLQANLPASVALLQEAARCGVRRLLLVSSGGTVYGDPLRLPIPEDHPTRPISPYGITKLTIESYGLMFHRTAELPVLIVRPANAYGEAQRTGVGQGFIAAAIEAVRAGRPVEVYGPQGTVRDYIHVDDVASGLQAALDHGEVGAVYNLGTGQGASNLELLEALEPLAAAEGLAVRCSHLPERRFDVRANVLDASRLSAVSGWRPQVDLADGLGRCWRAAATAGPSA
jgi:UDP-glucose 4-epimerase